jgi:hypothetical protein
MEPKCKHTILICLVSGPELSTVDDCSLEVHRHAALLVVLKLAGH